LTAIFTDLILYFLFLASQRFSIMRALIAMLLVLLAIAGQAMSQAMDPNAQRIVAACGVPTAMRVKTFGAPCQKAAIKAKKMCPSACKSLISSIKTPTCGAAVNAATPRTVLTKIQKVRPAWRLFTGLP
jgi:hypothetical protein